MKGSEMTVVERVARGYEWLKANRAGHLSELDPASLDVESAWDCPLGQTGTYYDAVADAVPYTDGVDIDQLGQARFDWAHAHGFAGGTYGGTHSETTEEDYKALNAAWRDILV